MPVYEYECVEDCKIERILPYSRRDEKTLCYNHMMVMSRVPSMFGMSVFQGVVTENLDGTPIRIGSRKQHRQEAHARGLIPITEKIDVGRIRKAQKEEAISQSKKSVEKYMPEISKLYDAHIGR